VLQEQLAEGLQHAKEVASGRSGRQQASNRDDNYIWDTPGGGVRRTVAQRAGQLGVQRRNSPRRALAGW
jgi:hypothetical protein